MQTPKLFTLLPKEYVVTPDGMAVNKQGDLILACPNFADLSYRGCLVKIDINKHISKWLDVPVEEETGSSRPMGIEFGPDGDVTFVTTLAGQISRSFSLKAECSGYVWLTISSPSLRWWPEAWSILTVFA